MPITGETRRDRSRSQTTTSLELFYDLVFVFAITQISQHLHGQLNWTGLGQSALLLLVVWWSWNYTTWVTNELDPDNGVVRLLVMALALASLLMAIAIPEAFGSRAGLFIGSYLAIQVGRHLFLTFAVGRAGTIERERAGRILAWFVLAGVFWVAGAIASGGLRTALWLIALVIDYGAPLALYWLPGRPPIEETAWEVMTDHFSERFGLFIIIALGESIVATGATASGLDLNATRVLGFAAAFFGTAALWWMYFAVVQSLGEQQLERDAHRTTLARDAYTYLHVLLVAAIIGVAVGDQIVLAHPHDSLGTADIAAVVGAPALFLLAHAAFKLRIVGDVSFRRVAGAAVCIVLGFALSGAEAIVVAAAMLAVLVCVVILDEREARRLSLV